ncbi:hypothetical protein MXB_34 [Myxobolus squamalis]|nr:hypothetical protein MXB_34 [Myxobolus squamalis]
MTRESTDKQMYRLPDSQTRLEFKIYIERSHDAVKNKIYPTRISEGSSGSYFVYDSEKKIIGVFKPKNEEPYGKLNPKWLKWLHRIFFPCCFGRSCIIPNKGYLSEAGAYLIDRFLDLDVVPSTFVTFLVSPTFNYSKLDRSATEARKYLKSKFSRLQNVNANLPSKIGSFQKFVNGFSNAYTYIQRFETETLPPEADSEFQYLLEKVVVLDYIVRNTDRGNNWLMKVDVEIEPVLFEGVIVENKKYHFNIAAIDNGLAFPFKHPDSWHPFDWAYIRYAKRPFSQKIKDLVIPKLSNAPYVESMIEQLELLFKIDKGFDQQRFDSQMSVMRGQVILYVST